ncbi:putative DNA-binding transcriptional regulator YafY [Breoghania corrubedonensis]|uniref:Putative DNA-binding transcriptional regulator YafY n=1 Tax=Breoghania corrubedonensis TaxID=665038 RepID=A0A2T5VB42_9HYPH|nr:WYL domain-containing protein [Breoghania corrubedonensis]PTW60961.1 putative DNA-binding transcriptional regulator YafY [Breoghania corrubedonensis]
MNPIERALGILLMLTGGKLVSAIALAERFEVTPRTIYRDIDRLLALGIPVEAERGAEGGYRLASGFIQPPVALSRNETAALLIALALVRGLRATPLSNDLETAERKLVAALPRSVHDLLANAERIIGIEPMPGDIFHHGTTSAPADDWQAALDRFMEGLLLSRRVRFDHHNPARDVARAHEVEPQGILFDRNHWYLAGRSLEAGALRLYRADRVRNVEVSGMRFRPDPDFTVHDLVGGQWLSQAMRRWEREDQRMSRIAVTAEQARKLRQDWYYRHATFTPAGDGRIVISIPNTDRDVICPLVRWLGPGAELLAPEDLRGDLARELDTMRESHRPASSR